MDTDDSVGLLEEVFEVIDAEAPSCGGCLVLLQEAIEDRGDVRHAAVAKSR
jgi:hypothetical protein